jgi:superfamily II helicase
MKAVAGSLHLIPPDRARWLQYLEGGGNLYFHVSTARFTASDTHDVVRSDVMCRMRDDGLINVKFGRVRLTNLGQVAAMATHCGKLMYDVLAGLHDEKQPTRLLADFYNKQARGTANNRYRSDLANALTSLEKWKLTEYRGGTWHMTEVGRLVAAYLVGLDKSRAIA